MPEVFEKGCEINVIQYGEGSTCISFKDILTAGQSLFTKVFSR